MTTEDGQCNSALGALWQSAALAGLGVAVSLLQCGVRLLSPCFLHPPPFEFLSMRWGLGLLSAGLTVLVLSCSWLFQIEKR